MIFAIGLFLFFIAVLCTAGKSPEPAGLFISCMGLIGAVLMMLSVCLLIAKVMP